MNNLRTQNLDILFNVVQRIKSKILDSNYFNVKLEVYYTYENKFASRVILTHWDDVKVLLDQNMLDEWELTEEDVYGNCMDIIDNTVLDFVKYFGVKKED